MRMGKTRRLMILAGVVILGAWGLSAQRSTPSRSLTLPIGGGALTIGDLNTDRKLDIITAQGAAVTVYLGDGRGRFDGAAGSPFAAGDNPSDLALGDFDEDGRLAVGVANLETCDAPGLWGLGTGGFAPPTHISVPSRPHPHGVAAADFDGDRHLDIAVESWEENTVLLFPGNGKAAFAKEPTRLAVGRVPYHKLRAGDFDNDGQHDLVTTNAQGSSVSVSCTRRSGALQPAQELAVARSPFAVAIGDVNGDRYPDLAIAHRWGSADPKLDGLTLLIGTGDCAFTPSSQSPLRVGTSPTDVAIGDFDGDGIGDIATANMGSDDVTMLLGSRQGGVKAAPGSPFSVGKRPLAIALADLNDDGKADIVTGNGASRDLSVVMSP